jgi:2-oxoacid dehydrogenases acyltransferase (catalytic domain)
MAMSSNDRGTWVPISIGRRLVMDELHHARKTPASIVVRKMKLAAIAEARKAVRPAPSWTALFMRAYGLVARKYPELRRAWVPLPWPHFYEHPHLVCVLVSEREAAGEQLLLASRFCAPEQMTLPDIDRRIQLLKEAPLEEIADFRRLLLYGRLPLPLRRLLGWLHMSWSGYVKASRVGNFTMSSVGSLGAEALNPFCLLTTHLSLGPIGPAGDVELSLTFDHRVLDGRPVARALNDLEEILNTTIVTELGALTPPDGVKHCDIIERSSVP